MKQKYEEILTAQENGRKIQITRSSSYFIVKIGRDGMKHYQKKAQSERCYDLDSLKRHLRQICSLHSIDYDRLENRLIKALKPRGEGVIPTTDEPMVQKGGILKKVQDTLESWLGKKTEQARNVPKLKTRQ